MTDLATLGIAVDSTQVKAGSTALEGLTAAGAAAEAQTKSLQSANSNYQSSLQQMAAKVNEVEQAYKATYTSSQSLTKGTNEATVALKAQTDAALAAARAQQTLAIQQANAAKLSALGVTANDLALNGKNVAGTITGLKAVQEAETETAKIVEGAAGSIAKSHGLMGLSALQVREPIVLLREAFRGDFSRMAGSASILLGTMSTSMLGIVALLALPVAAMATLVAAMVQGEQEATKLGQALTSTGNFAGETAGNIDKLAHSLASGNVSTGETRRALEDLTASGYFNAASIDAMTKAAVAQANISGGNADKIAQSYEKAEGNVVQFGVQHAEIYHDLTLSQLQRIKELDDEGKHQEAISTLFTDIANNLNTRTVPAYYGLAGAVHNVTVLASNMWDALLGIGRPQTVEDHINATTAEINETQRSIAMGNMSSSDTAIAKKDLRTLQDSLQKLQTQKADQENQVADASRAAQGEDDKIRNWNDTKDQHDPKGKQPDDVKYNKQTDKINQQAEGLLSLARAQDQSDAAAMRAKTNADALTDATDKNISKTETDARAQANLALEVSKAIEASAKKTAAMAQDNALQEAANDNVRAGNETSLQAQQNMQKEIQLRPLIAALANAQGQALKDATKAIKDESDAIDRNNLDKFTQQLLASNAAAEDQSIILQAQIKLANADNATRAVTIAQLQEKIKLEAKGSSLTPDGQKAIALAGNNAQLGVDAQNAAIGGSTAGGTSMANQIATDIKFQADRVARAKAAYAQIDVLRKADVLNDTQAAKAKAQVDATIQNERLANASQFFGDLSSLTKLKSKELQAIGKAAAIVQATIDTYAAVNKTYSATPYPWSIPLAIAVGVAGAANVAAIAGLKDGGAVEGPGGPRDDKVLKWLSNGEFVVNAEATSKNRPLLEALNGGKAFPANQNNHYANGGFVGGNSTSTSTVGGNVFDFRGANFGGADPDQIEARLRKVIEKEYAPAIVNASVVRSVQATKQLSGRQNINGKGTAR